MAAYHCCVPLCTNDSRYDEKKQLSFHRFSGENKLRKEWIANISHDIGSHFQVIHTEMIVVHIRYILLPSRRTYTLLYKFVKRIRKSKLRYNRGKKQHWFATVYMYNRVDVHKFDHHMVLTTNSF